MTIRVRVGAEALEVGFAGVTYSSPGKKMGVISCEIITQFIGPQNFKSLEARGRDIGQKI